jgi:pimeloyl-ACP methyl ester carboxylesterase
MTTTPTSHATRRSGGRLGRASIVAAAVALALVSAACGDDDAASPATTTIAPTTTAPTRAATTTATPTATVAATTAGPTTAAPTTTATSTGAGTAAFEDAACPSPNIPGAPSLDFPTTAECGYLTVPEDRSKADGRMIRIFVVRFPALSATPKPDPIVVLSGGPGGGGSFEFTAWVRSGVNAERDLILFDQRGTHLSEPRLPCADYDDALNSAISTRFTSDEQVAKQAAAVKACRDRLTAAGIDVAAYDSAENAADLADLRVALGIDEWNVYGVSYGSKLALVELRDHPEGIRSVVIDSVSPPNNQIAETWWSAPANSFKAIFAACAAQSACAAAFPNLEADFFATVERLDETPVVVETSDDEGEPLTVNIDAFPFLYAIIMASERGDASGVPKMIDDMAHGDPASTVKAVLALQTPPEFVGLTGLGLAFTVFCAESANLTTEAAALAHARSVLPELPERVLRVMPKQGRLFQECPAWDVPDAEPAMSAPVESDVPVLILEGDFDAATAPEWVDLVTPGLPNSQFVAFPFTGHNVLKKSPCSLEIFHAFLDDPTSPVDPACAGQIDIPFITD